MDAEALTWLDATSQAELVRSGEVGAVELADAAIARIEATRELNAVILDQFEGAREAAAALPRPPADDAPPFAGVPFLLKDLGQAMAGVPETMGSVAVAGWTPEHTAHTVQRALDAGLVVCGRTNTPEFGNFCATEPTRFGPTLNPWAADRSPGGSSGGSAAAVAAGLVAAASASDGTGSIRVPASCCGLVGLKPRRGRTSFAPAAGQVLGGLANAHVLTRSVRDSAALLDALAGPVLGDPYEAPTPPPGGFLAAMGAPPVGARVLLAVEPPFPGALDPRVRSCVEAVAHALEGLGHVVEPGRPKLDPDVARRAIATVHAVDNAGMHRFVSEVLGRPPRHDELEPVTWDMVRDGLATTGLEYADAVDALYDEGRRASAVFAEHDVILCATLNTPGPPPPGVVSASQGSTELFFAQEFAVTGWTTVANLAGWAAISLPLGEIDGLPVGVQLMAPGEEVLLGLAAQLEQAMPWAGRRPPGYA